MLEQQQQHPISSKQQQQQATYSIMAGATSPRNKQTGGIRPPQASIPLSFHVAGKWTSWCLPGRPFRNPVHSACGFAVAANRCNRDTRQANRSCIKPPSKVSLKIGAASSHQARSRSAPKKSSFYLLLSRRHQ